MQPVTKELQSMEDTYFLIESIPEEQTFEEEMLLHNSIDGLLPMETGWHSGMKFHRYQCTGMMNLSRFLQGKEVSGEQFETLFTEVFERIRRAKEFFLREDGFYITPESIYIHPADRKPYLCYLPEYHKPLVDQMKELSTWFLSRIDVNDSTAVYDGYAFHVLCHKETCNFDTISSVLEERPSLPEVTMWEEEAEDNCEKIEKKGGTFLRKASVFIGSIVFAAGIGTLLLLVMR